MRWGNQASRAVALLAVLATNTPACQDTGAGRSGVCWVDTRGVAATEDGTRVTDVVTARCDVRPEQHTVEAWLEYKTNPWGGWTSPRFPRRDSTIPDQEGVSLLVGLDCKPGFYRAAWRTTGRGPALPDRPGGIEFDVLDADFGSTRIAATDCKG